MHIARNGKIARLPYALREELNNRLLDGEPAKGILSWLNQHPKVREILDAGFDGRKINPQNLSDWRLGGFQDWFEYQKRIEWARSLGDEAHAMQDAAGGGNLSGCLSVLAALALGKLLRSFSDTHDWEKPNLQPSLLPLIREIIQLHRADNQAERTRLLREKWEVEKARKSIPQAGDKAQNVHPAPAVSPLRPLPLRSSAVKERSPQGTQPRPSPPPISQPETPAQFRNGFSIPKPQPNQTQSKLIQVDQAESSRAPDEYQLPPTSGHPPGIRLKAASQQIANLHAACLMATAAWPPVLLLLLHKS